MRAQVWRARQVADADHPYRGHFIPEAEIDALLARPDALPEWVRREAPLPPVELRRVLARIEATIDVRVQAALRAGHRPPLLALRDNFALDRFQYDAFLFALAVELDSRFERLYAYLHDDVSRRRPSVDLLLNLGCCSAAERLRRRRDLSSEGTLLRAGLLVWEADPSRAGGSSRLVGSLRVPEAVVDFLTASEPRPSSGELVNTPRPLSAWFGPDDVRARLRAVADELRTPSLEPATSAHQPGTTTICLRGPHGCGRRTAAEGIAESLGRPLLVVDLPAERSEEHVTEARRDAGLWGALLLWRWSAESLPPSAVASPRGAGIPHPIELIAAPADTPPLPQSRHERVLELSLPSLSTTSRRCVWERALAPLGDTAALDLDTLASRFRFGGDKIAQVAASLASDDRERAEPLATPAIYAASRRHSRVAVAGLASHITPRRSWPDLILAADIEEQLRLIERRVRHRTTVLETWGLGARMPEARGTHALFAGPPGTGKTLAAEVIADSVGLDLLVVDLARVVSKYIGETEKHLATIFAEAEAANAILFFDEADALFGKRTAVHDAHDRYANIQVSDLLQRMEAYSGLCILATNQKGNIDEAFLRRLACVVDFRLPDVDERRRIWEVHLPATLPQEGLDLDQIAEYRLSGAGIRNAVLEAAYLAADSHNLVQRAHIGCGVRSEFQKHGRPC